MEIAKDVTDSEFKKARFQSRLTWVITFSVPLAAFLYWLLVDASFFHSNNAPPYRLAIVWGILANRVAYFIFKDGRKMGSLRMQQYVKLKKFRLAREKSKSL